MSEQPDKKTRRPRYVDQQWWYRALILACFVSGIRGWYAGRQRPMISGLAAGCALLAFTLFAHRMRFLERKRAQAQEKERK